MYIGKEAFIQPTDRQSAKELFAKTVSRVEVETHSYCNRRCDYCPNAVGDRLGENMRMADDLWFLLLDNLKEIGFKQNFIFTSYNEPLADQFILQRIKEARTYLPNARLMIYTNGDYLCSTYLEELAESGLNYLHISIHTRPGDQYAEVPALNHISKVVKRMGTGVKYQQIKPGEYIFAKVPHPKMDIEIRAINYTRHGTDRGGLVEGIIARPDRTAPCHFPFAHFHMGFEGTVVPCCHIRSDSPEHQKYRYGNLREYGSIFEIFASKIATDWRRHLISFEPKAEPCRTCTVAFLSQDPAILAKAKSAWERHVRDCPTTEEMAN